MLVHDTRDLFAEQLSAHIAESIGRNRRQRPTESENDELEAAKRELRALADTSKVMEPTPRRKAPPKPAEPSPAEPKPWPDPAKPPAPWPATPPQPWPGDDGMALQAAITRMKRSEAAIKAAANRDSFAAARKAAYTRAARRAPPAPPPFPDYVSERIGTRRWTVGPVPVRARALYDRILSADWLAALQDAYRAAFG